MRFKKQKIFLRIYYIFQYFTIFTNIVFEVINLSKIKKYEL